MKAIILNGFGDVNHLVEAALPTPAINDNEVLVQVKAISVNPVDAKTRTGKAQAANLKDENPIILGWDISGTVTDIGKNVTGFKVGDEVFGMINFPGHGRAYAEYVAAPANQLALKPANLTHAEAAASTLALLTAYQIMVHNANVQPGQRVLVHAASGGVGHFAVQLAKHLGAYVIGTSSAANKDFVLSLGTDEHIDYKTQQFEDIAHDIDFVLDAFGGDHIDRSLQVIKPGGTIITLPSAQSGGVTEKAAAKGVRGLFVMVKSNGGDMEAIAAILQSGAIKPYVSQTFPFSQMREAHVQIESGRTVGKIVVVV